MAFQLKRRKRINMSDSRSDRSSKRLPFPLQLLVTGIIVAALAWAARLASTPEGASAFDEAAEETRFEFEGAARGVVLPDPADDGAQRPDCSGDVSHGPPDTGGA